MSIKGSDCIFWCTEPVPSKACPAGLQSSLEGARGGCSGETASHRIRRRSRRSLYTSTRTATVSRTAILLRGFRSPVRFSEPKVGGRCEPENRIWQSILRRTERPIQKSKFGMLLLLFHSLVRSCQGSLFLINGCRLRLNLGACFTI